jgi:signal transduction histidine kinase
MNGIRLPKWPLFIFIFMMIFLLAQAVWWFIFMEILVNEKIDLATQLGATYQMLEVIGAEEKARQRMVFMEAAFFFLVLGFGLLLIYRALAKQHELTRQQENFMMAVTHELKTPLASLSIHIDGLSAPEIPDNKKAELIPRMKNDVNRLRKQVQDVLEASAALSPEKLHTKERFNLSTLLAERFESLKRAHNPGQYTLNCSIVEEIYLNGDRRAIGRAIDSILENSIIHNSGKQIEIQVKLYRDNQKVVLEIADNGVGVGMVDLGKIFERFYRVGSELTRTAQGTGLGLFICREIFKAHGGKVWAISDGPGTGLKIVAKMKEG